MERQCFQAQLDFFRFQRDGRHYAIQQRTDQLISLARFSIFSKPLGAPATTPIALSTLISAGVSVAGVVALSRLLSAAGYGAYASALAMVTLGHNAVFFWLQTSILRFHARSDSDSSEQRLATAIKSAFLLATIVAAGIWFLSVRWLGRAGVEPGLAFAGLMLLLVRGWFSLTQAWNRAHGHPWRYMFLETLQALGSLLLGLGALWIAPGAPVAPIAGAVLATIIALLFSTELVRIPIRFESIGPLLLGLRSYGAPLAMVSLATSLLAISDRLLIAVMVSPAAAGIYSVAFAISDRAINLLLLPVPVAAKSAVFAAFEKPDEGAARQLLDRSAGWLMHLGFPTTVFLVCQPAPIAELLIGGGMAREAGLIIPWLAVGSLLASFISLHFSLAFQLTRRTIWMLAALGPPAVVNIAANLFLLPRFGMIAAAWTTVGSYALALVLTIMFGRHQIRIPFPPGKLGRSLLACVPLIGFLQIDFGRGVGAVASAVAGGVLIYWATSAFLHRTTRAKNAA